MIDLERAKILVSGTIRVVFERYKASWIEWNESHLSPDRSPPRLVRGTESGSDERGNRATLCACSVSLPSVRSDLSLCHRLRCLALRFSLPPPSLSLSRVTSAPGIPRLRRYERQRRKSERASWAAKRRGVVNDSSEPRSAFLPRALSLPLAMLRYFLSLQLCGPVAA